MKPEVQPGALDSRIKTQRVQENNVVDERKNTSRGTLQIVSFKL